MAEELMSNEEQLEEGLIPAGDIGPEPISNPALRPGTPWGDTLAQNQAMLDRAARPRAARNALQDGFESTALSGMLRNVRQRVDTSQGVLSTIGQTAVAATGQAGRWGESDWNKADHYDELTADIPMEFWDDIFEQTTLEGAKLTRGNIQSDLQRMQRMGLDSGAAALHAMAGSLADVDMPLVLLSGGGFGVAKAAGRVAYSNRLRGSTALATERAAGITSGVVAGAQAGVLVGGLDALNRDTTTWMDGIRTALTMTAFGGAVGAAAPRMMMNLKDVEADFTRRMREGDPTVWDDPASIRPVDVNAGRINTVMDAAEDVAQDTSDMSIGAAASPGTTRASMRPQTGWVNDLGSDPVTSRQQAIIQQARDWQFNTGYRQRFKEATENFVDNLFTKPWMNPGTNNVMQMVRSQGDTLNWLSGTIFEVASGVVRGDTTTAAVLMRQYQGRLSRHVNHEQSIVGAWAKRTGQATMDPTGNFVVRVKPEGYRQFYREVLLDMAADGQTTMRSSDPDVRRMSDSFNSATEEALAMLKGRPGETAVTGFENAAHKGNYVPYRWYPSSFMQALSRKLPDGSNALNKDMLVEGFARGYTSKGTFSDPKTAKQAAEALVNRFVSRGQGIDESIQSIFSKDGRDYLEKSMQMLNKYTDQEIADFMQRFDRDLTNARKDGFAKRKSEIDLNTEIVLRDGSTMKIIEFLDPDLSAVMQRYFRQVAGHSALARKGIPDIATRNDVVAAARAEQRSLGEYPMDQNVLEAMFSEFDGAAQVGAAMGQKNNGIGAAAELKSLGSLSMLQLNGFAQAAETGVGMVAVGLSNWFNRGVGRMIDDAIKNSNTQVLDEMMFFTGEIGKDQHTFRPHLVLDEAVDYRGNDKVTKALSVTRGLIAQGNYIQGYTSGLNAVREFQQKVAWLGMSDKIFKTINADIVSGKFANADWAMNGRMYRDLGLDRKQYWDLRELIETGVVEIKTAKTVLGDIQYVNRLNIDKWDADLAQDFMSALARNEAQLVQRPLAGETDRWMHTQLGAVLTHLQTFPILAIQKQGARNAGQMDMQAAAQTMGGLASAYVAISLRDTIAGRERDGVERGKAAFAYANISGWVSLYNDPVMTALGLHDFRVNGFGAYAKPLSAPAIDIANNLIRAPGAVAQAVLGEDELSGGERSAIRTLPFVRLIDTVTGLAGANLLDDPNRKSNQDKANEALDAFIQSVLEPE